MFEQILSSRRDRDRTPARTLSFPAAVGLHLVAFGAIVGASMWATEEPPDPAVPVVFHLPAASAGPAGATRTSGQPPRKRVAVQPLPRSAPRAFPTTLSPLPPEEETVGTPDDVEGPETGLPEGPPGGIPGAPGTGRPGPGTDLLTEPPRPGGDIHAPDLVRRVEPIYPETARRASWKGSLCLTRSSR